jgi:transcriptional regulator with XRE-family HTH domain
MMLSEQLDHLMTTLGISHAELARALGISDRTVMRWLADEMYPQHESRRKLDDLNALVQRLDESFKTQKGASTWLHSSSGYFGGLRPVDALLLGRIDAVDAALEALDAGVFV